MQAPVVYYWTKIVSKPVVKMMKGEQTKVVWSGKPKIVVIAMTDVFLLFTGKPTHMVRYAQERFLPSNRIDLRSLSGYTSELYLGPGGAEDSLPVGAGAGPLPEAEEASVSY